MTKDDIKQYSMPGIKPFIFKIAHSVTNKAIHKHEIDLHSHNEWEIYINISGDVSFLVDNNLYPVNHGDIIITKPHQQHHCVYRSDYTHELYCIFIDGSPNEVLNDFPFGEDISTHICLPKDLKEKLIRICKDLSNENNDDYVKFKLFFDLINTIQQKKPTAINIKETLPEDLKQIFKYIDEHITESLQVRTISKALYISESTIVRRFKQYVNFTPLEFIKKRKLALATEYLISGYSVLNAGASIGFNDNSYFIKIFKEQYGITPNEYKKQYKANNK